MHYLETLDFSIIIGNFKEITEEFKDYDSELLLKIINKTLFETKKVRIKNYLQMKIGKLIQKILVI